MPAQAQKPLPTMAGIAPRASSASGYQRRTGEANEQVKLFRFLREQAHRAPVLSLVHSSLNGMYLQPKVHNDAKAQGMLKGVWDILINVPASVPAGSPISERLTQCLPNTVVFGDNHTPQSYSGLYVEMKHSTDLTDSQVWFRDFTISKGINTATNPHLYSGPAFTVCHTAWEAAEVLIHYAGITDAEILSDLERNKRYEAMVIAASAPKTPARGKGVAR